MEQQTAAPDAERTEVNMDSVHSFDIAFHGLRDPSPTGRARLTHTMERLTGRPAADCEDIFTEVGRPIFESLPVDQAKLIVEALDEAGVYFEVSPKYEAAVSVDEGLEGGMMSCPSCGFVQKSGADECGRCGVVFSKMEREEISKMQMDKDLLEAQQRAEQIRQEWDERAKHLLENRPLHEEATQLFGKVLTQEEIPFLLLGCAEGNVLMTSRQFLVRLESDFAFIPYEIIRDIDFGGGLAIKKDYTRLVLNFHSPLPIKNKNASSLTLQLDKEAATNKETIIDWAYARSHICGSCGARDLDYRQDKDGIHARCMHCATDHKIDLRHHTITALVRN
jgi:hypothetical protein